MPRIFFVAAALFFGAAIVALLSVALSGVWPGVYTADSFMFPPLAQGVTSFVPLHYSLYLGAIFSVSSHPAASVIAQILLFALLTSLLLTMAWSLRIRWYWYIASAFLLMLSPFIPLYLATMWKDVPYALGICTIGTLLFLVTCPSSLSRRDRLLSVVLLGCLTVVTGGLRHNGALLPFLVGIILYLRCSFSLSFASLFVALTIVTSVFVTSILSVACDVKAGTDFKRLSLSPYLVYAGYVPWEKYVSKLSLERAKEVVDRVSIIGDIRDQVGIDLSFMKGRVNLSPSDSQISDYASEVRKAVVSEPLTVMWRLLRANQKLLLGEGYIWDRGFLPLPYSYVLHPSEWTGPGIAMRLANKSPAMMLPSPYFSETPSAFPGQSIVRGLEKLLTYRTVSPLLSILFSALPHLLVLAFYALFSVSLPMTRTFSFFVLLTYGTVFILPSSSEFRYAFFLLLGGTGVPLLAGIESGMQRTLNHQKDIPDIQGTSPSPRYPLLRAFKATVIINKRLIYKMYWRRFKRVII